MENKVNEKNAWPKVCSDCEIELNPGVNCYLSMFKRSIYKCKACKKLQSKKEHKANWPKQSFRDKKKAYLKEYHISEGAGVYGIFEKGECIYIGETDKIRQRITSHFSKNMKTPEQLDKGYWQSPIPILLAKGKLDREELDYEVFELIDDKLTRQTRETWYIKKYIAEYGEAPRFNTYKTK